MDPLRFFRYVVVLTKSGGNFSTILIGFRAFYMPG
jgi:ABC-type uncharacterized transport system permease subunit